MKDAAELCHVARSPRPLFINLDFHVALLRSWQSQKVAGDPSAFGDDVPSDADSTSILVFQSCRISSSLCLRNGDSA